MALKLSHCLTLWLNGCIAKSPIQLSLALAKSAQVSFVLQSLFWSRGLTEVLSGFLAEVMALNHRSSWDLWRRPWLLSSLPRHPDLAGAEENLFQASCHACPLLCCFTMPPATPQLWSSAPCPSFSGELWPCCLTSHLLTFPAGSKSKGLVCPGKNC